jgi:glycerol-3-phosphate cytidylyltransferase
MSEDKEAVVNMVPISPYRDIVETLGDSVGTPNIGVSVIMDPDLSEEEPKIGFTCGAFDLLHAGHVLMLEEARQQCDHLIVAVQSDPSIDRPEKNTPLQSHEERLIIVESIKWVDEVITYDTEDQLYSLLQEINPDVRIVGADWRGKTYTGHDLDIDMYFNTRDHSWSTSELRKRVHSAEDEKIKSAK